MTFSDERKNHEVCGFSEFHFYANIAADAIEMNLTESESESESAYASAWYNLNLNQAGCKDQLHYRADASI